MSIPFMVNKRILTIHHCHLCLILLSIVTVGLTAYSGEACNCLLVLSLYNSVCFANLTAHHHTKKA